MTNIRIDYTLSCENESDARQLFKKLSDELSGFQMIWTILEHSFELSSDVVIQSKESQQVSGFYSMLYERAEDDECIELIKEKEENSRTKHIAWNIRVTLSGEIDADISVEHNYVLFSDSRKYSVREIIENDLSVMTIFDSFLDEYIERIKQRCFGFLMALLLSKNEIWPRYYGSYTIYLNNTKYKDYFAMELPLLNDLHSSKYYNLFPERKLSVRKCWDWISNHTDICESVKKSPVYYNSLSYIFNREIYESIVYAHLALESLYLKPNEKNIAFRLRKRIHVLFPKIEEDVLKEIYGKRSGFVHGKTFFSLYDSYLLFDVEEVGLFEDVNLLLLILMESIRILIDKDATKFLFSEEITYKCE